MPEFVHFGNADSNLIARDGKHGYEYYDISRKKFILRKEFGLKLESEMIYQEVTNETIIDLFKNILIIQQSREIIIPFTGPVYNDNDHILYYSNGKYVGESIKDHISLSVSLQSIIACTNITSNSFEDWIRYEHPLLFEQ